MGRYIELLLFHTQLEQQRGIDIRWAWEAHAHLATCNTRGGSTLIQQMGAQAKNKTRKPS